MSISTLRPDTKRATPNLPESVTTPDAAGAQPVGVKPEGGAAASEPRSGEPRDITKSVTPPVREYDRQAEITRYVRRGISRKMLWSQAFIDSGQGRKKSAETDMRLVGREVLRPAFCGQRLSDYADLRLNVSGLASYAGVMKCSSVWSCPTCAATVRQRRSMEIGKAVEAHQKAGGGLLFLTLTMRHTKTMPLAFTLDALLEAFRRTVRGAPWKRQADDLGLIGFIKAVEITVSDGDGWHPHLHVLLFTESHVSDAALEAFRSWVFDRWAGKLDAVAESWAEQAGGRKWSIRPNKVHGVDLQRVDDHGQVVALYLSKIQDDHAKTSHRWQVSGEMTRADVKTGRAGDGDVHVNPFQLLDGDDCPLPWTAGQRMKKWIEYVRFTKGRRCIVWTPGLKDRFGVEDLTDEEIIANEMNHAVVAWQADADGYDDALKRHPETLAQAKQLAEKQDWRGVADLLPGRLRIVMDDPGLWKTVIGDKGLHAEVVLKLDELWRERLRTAV